jgi:hypothetical protein
LPSGKARESIGLIITLEAASRIIATGLFPATTGDLEVPVADHRRSFASQAADAAGHPATVFKTRKQDSSQAHGVAKAGEPSKCSLHGLSAIEFQSPGRSCEKMGSKCLNLKLQHQLP